MKPLEPHTFFLDRSLGKEVIATALRDNGILVEVHDNHFPSNARDEVWLAEVGSRGWIVLTKDRRFHNRVLEITAIANAGVRVFKLTAGGLQGSEMAEIFVRAIGKIGRVASGNPGPFIATLSRSGRVVVVMNATKLRKYR